MVELNWSWFNVSPTLQLSRQTGFCWVLGALCFESRWILTLQKDTIFNHRRDGRCKDIKARNMPGGCVRIYDTSITTSPSLFWKGFEFEQVPKRSKAGIGWGWWINEELKRVHSKPSDDLSDDDCSPAWTTTSWNGGFDKQIVLLYTLHITNWSTGEPIWEKNTHTHTHQHRQIGEREMMIEFVWRKWLRIELQDSRQWKARAQDWCMQVGVWLGMRRRRTG